jgi:tartrate dehydratase alpha subunit/fumarate hydratase class I-like protein
MGRRKRIKRECRDKVKYATAQEAAVGMQNGVMERMKLKAYACLWCSGFHVGHTISTRFRTTENSNKKMTVFPIDNSKVVPGEFQISAKAKRLRKELQRHARVERFS